MNSLRRIARFLFNTPLRVVLLRTREKLLHREVISEDSPQFEWVNLKSCTFFLSTGRVGTQTLAALCNEAKTIYSYHEPSPRLYGIGQQAYLVNQTSSEINQLLLESLVACRQDLLLRSWHHHRGYLETSPQVTFLAPFIQQLLPHARFIHVVRNPGDVIRSAMRRGWYNGHRYDRTRIFPKVEDPWAQQWSSFTPFEKNIWLWHETNRWIANFCETLSPERNLLLRAEDIFAGDVQTIEQLFRFLDEQPPTGRTVQQVIGKQLNAQKSGEFLLPQEWSLQMKEQFYCIAGNTASRLGYSL